MDGVTDLTKTLSALTDEYRALHEALRVERRRLAEVVLQLGPGPGGGAAVDRGRPDVADAAGYGPSGSPESARPAGSVVRERA